MKMIRVLVVDDNSLLRLGLVGAIGGEDDMEAAGEAENGAEGIEQFRTLRPDVVTMDYKMPGDSGVETTKKLLAEFPEAKVILLSVYEGDEDVWSSVQVGAKGYLNKTASIDEILDAIREVEAGGTYFPSGIVRKLERRSQRENLTSRETEVLVQIVKGFSNKEIMSELSISEGMVKLHVSRILKKLGAADRTQAAIAAVREGIVHLDS